MAWTAKASLSLCGLILCFRPVSGFMSFGNPAFFAQSRIICQARCRLMPKIIFLSSLVTGPPRSIYRLIVSMVSSSAGKTLCRRYCCSLATLSSTLIPHLGQKACVTPRRAPQLGQNNSIRLFKCLMVTVLLSKSMSVTVNARASEIRQLR